MRRFSRCFRRVGTKKGRLSIHFLGPSVKNSVFLQHLARERLRFLFIRIIVIFYRNIAGYAGYEHLIRSLGWAIYVQPLQCPTSHGCDLPIQ
jgi:hypothetical protein